MKRLLSFFGLLALLLATFATPAFAGSSDLIVDDDFGTTAACKGAQFKDIQSAVDAASSGAKITVCPGTYRGATIEKSLKLVAKPALQAHITGSGTGFGIRGASDVRVEGFEISGTDFAIVAAGANRLDIRENDVHDNKVFGIAVLESSTGGTIRDNQVVNNGNGSTGGSGGIALGGVSGYKVKKNKVNGNKGSGITLFIASNNHLESNTTNDNAFDGVSICSGSKNNLVEKGTANNNHQDGIGVDSNSLQCAKSGSPSAGNTLKKNSMKGNSHFDAEDTTKGDRTAGTANTWKDDKCVTSSPLGLCVK